MSGAPGVAELAARIGQGDRRALARAITWVESGHADSEPLLEALYARSTAAYRIGITGPPGAGKSTLTAALVAELRKRGAPVGVLAIDPSSPFTHGALLGDRVRMSAVSDDPGVYIRSMATRGAVGGLAAATADAADLIAAAGYDYVLIETAGVGQTELDIAGAADTTVLVLVPEGGDFVQALKAGILEIADVYVVNKADRPGAGEAVDALRSVVHARAAQTDGWRLSVLETVALEGRGVEQVAAEILRHRAHLSASGDLDQLRAARLHRRVQTLVEAALRERIWTDERQDQLRAMEARLLDGRTTPHAVAREIISALGAR